MTSDLDAARARQESTIFGDIVASEGRGVATEVWRSTLLPSGEKTGYVRREKGRPVGDIARDLQAVICDCTYEWATCGQPFKYGASLGASERTECPAHDGISVRVSHGGSEGHLVHVEVILQEDRDRPIKTVEALARRHLTIFMVKVLTGRPDAVLISERLADALGVA